MAQKMARALDAALIASNKEYVFEIRQNAIRSLASVKSGVDSEPYADIIARASNWLCQTDPGNPSSKQLLFECLLINPQDVNTLHNLGFLCQKHNGDLHFAMLCYREVLRYDPAFELSYVALSEVLREFGDYEAEREIIRQGLEHCKDSPTILHAMGVNTLRRHDYRDLQAVLDMFVACFKMKPGRPLKSLLHIAIAHVHLMVGNVADGLSHFVRAIFSNPNANATWSNLALSLLYFPDDDPSVSAALKRLSGIDITVDDFHAWFVNKIYPIRTRDAPRLTRRRDFVRIGYVGADFRNHPVAHFVTPLLKNPGSRTQVYVYSTRIYCAQDVTYLMPEGYATDQYRCISGLTDQQVVSQMADDDLDALVDLSGHTEGGRLSVIQPNAAPVLLSHIGYPRHSGIQGSLHVGDVFTEKFTQTPAVTLKGPFLCYDPLLPKEILPEVLHEKWTSNQQKVTFGCFARLQKINDRVIECWIQVLRSVPGSILVVKARQFCDDVFATDWKNRFREVAAQVETRPGSADFNSHISAYNTIHIALDTFPYSGTTISMESLFMGVPIVTYSGRSHTSRVTGSTLHFSGMDELICYSEEEYVAAAVKLAQNWQSGYVKLTPGVVSDKFRKGLLMDQKRYGQEFEDMVCGLVNNRGRKLESHVNTVPKESVNP